MTRVDGSPSQWRTAPREEFLWAEFKGEYVLFHRRSGQTHFLNAASATLLQQILIDATDLDAACRSFTTMPARGMNDMMDGDEATPELRQYLRAILDRFEELGLVRRIEA